LESGCVCSLALLIVTRLKLGWWDIADSAVQTPPVPPIHPAGGGQLQWVPRPPGPLFVDHLGFVETVDRLGHGVGSNRQLQVIPTISVGCRSRTRFIRCTVNGSFSST